MHDQHRDHSHGHHHDHAHHDHSHGLIDESILRSKAGVRAVSQSLVVLFVTAAIQLFIFLTASSVSLFADIVHNFGDALTAIPLGAAFLLRSKHAEKYSGYFVVGTILVSAGLSAWQAFDHLFHPEALNEHVGILILAGFVGFVGNEWAASIRLHAGKRLHSAALIADGNHARADGYVSLSVVAAAFFIWLGLNVADSIIGLIVTALILRITWQSYQSIRDAE